MKIPDAIRRWPVELLLLVALLWPAWLFLSGMLGPGPSATPVDIPLSVGADGIMEHDFTVERSGDYRISVSFGRASPSAGGAAGDSLSPGENPVELEWSISSRGELVASGQERAPLPAATGGASEELGLGWFRARPDVDYRLGLEVGASDPRWADGTARLSISEPLAWERSLVRQAKGVIVGVPLLLALFVVICVRQLVSRIREWRTVRSRR